MSSSEVYFRKSNRVILRPIEANDASSLYRWINDPEVTQFLTIHTPTQYSEEVEWIADQSKDKSKNIVVGIMVEGRLIGTMGLHNIDMKNRHATTGTLIGEKDCWGKGFGTEAKMLLLDYTFNELGLHKVYSKVVEYNERSIAYARKCGYGVEGVSKEHTFARGRYWNEINLAVFNANWQPLWEKFRKEHGL